MGRPSKYVFDYDAVVNLLCSQRLSVLLAARQLGCSADSLRHYVEVNNIALPKRCISANTPSINKADPKDMQKLLNDKYTFKQIADKFGCTESAVADFVKRHSLTVQRYNAVPEEAILRELYCEKLWSVSDIATHCGASLDRIRSALSTFQIERSPEQQLEFRRKVSSKISRVANDRSRKAISSVPTGKILYDEVVNSSLTEVSRKYAVSVDIIKRAAKESGYDVPAPSPIDKDVLQKLLDGGRLIKDIAQIVNRSDATVRKYIRQYNLSRSEEGERIVKQRRADIARQKVLEQNNSTLPNKQQLQELVNDYKNYHEIAEIFGCGDSVIGTCVSRYGIRFPEDYNEVITQRYVNKGKLTIQQRYGVFPYALSKYSNKAQAILTDSKKLREFLLSIPDKDRTLSRCCYDLGIPDYLLNSYMSKYNLDIPMASKLGSSLEEQLRHTLDKWNVQYTRNTKKIIAPKEIDFYFENKNLGIEVNGNWAHSTTSSGKYVPLSKDYHRQKTRMCKDRNIRLIHLFEYEMSNAHSWHRLQRFLHDVICEPTRFAYARELKIKLVDNDLERAFLDYNHLQGYVGSRVCLGLFDNGELVMVMSFGKPRYNKNYEWELLRLCTRGDVAVIGGAEKLFKYFVNNYGPNLIVSYCDLSKFEGRVYTKLGMNLVRESDPNYKWVKFNEVYSRYQTQKHKLPKLLGNIFDPSLSEADNMIKAGFVKIYDCGNAVYEWRK